MLTIISTITILTQIILPFFIQKLEFFWFFKKKNEEKIESLSTLDVLEEKVDNVVENYNIINDEVNETVKKVTKIKNKTKI